MAAERIRYWQTVAARERRIVLLWGFVSAGLLFLLPLAGCVAFLLAPAAFVCFTIALFRWRRCRRLDHALRRVVEVRACPDCDYALGAAHDLVLGPKVCPECGMEFPYILPASPFEVIAAPPKAIEGIDEPLTPLQRELLQYLAHLPRSGMRPERDINVMTLWMQRQPLDFRVVEDLSLRSVADYLLSRRRESMKSNRSWLHIVMAGAAVLMMLPVLFTINLYLAVLCALLVSLEVSARPWDRSEQGVSRGQCPQCGTPAPVAKEAPEDIGAGPPVCLKCALPWPAVPPVTSDETVAVVALLCRPALAAFSTDAHTRAGPAPSDVWDRFSGRFLMVRSRRRTDICSHTSAGLTECVMRWRLAYWTRAFNSKRLGLTILYVSGAILLVAGLSVTFFHSRMWFPFVLVLLFAVAIFGNRHRHLILHAPTGRIAKRHCPNCDYSLVSNHTDGPCGPERCSECGMDWPLVPPEAPDEYLCVAALGLEKAMADSPGVPS